MMADDRNIAICDTALADAALVTADTAAPGVPATNLQTSQPGEVWRSNYVASGTFVVDLGEAAPVRAIALLYSNLSDTATWRVRGAASEAALGNAPRVEVAQAFGSTLPRDARGWRHGLAYLRRAAAAAIWTNRWWQIDLSDAANPDGYLEAGRLVMADPWQPECNLSLGWDFIRRDASLVERMVGGQLRTELRGAHDEFAFDLDWLSRAEAYANLGPLLDGRRKGGAGDLLVIRDPTAPDWDAEMIYGPPATERTFGRPYIHYYRTRITVQERPP